MKEKVEYRIASLLRNGGGTLSVAESCTGGEISHLITTVSGSSEYYLGSVTSYAVSVKRKLLGVPAATIEEHGVVSREVAAAMAEGVRAATGSDYSVATTGLAEGGDGLSSTSYCIRLDRGSSNELKNIIRFWCDRGVDGFRVDMASSLVKGDNAERDGVRRLWREIFEWYGREYPENIMLSEWSEPKQSLSAGFDIDLMIHNKVGGKIYRPLVCATDDRMNPTVCYFDRRGQGEIRKPMEIYREVYEASRKTGGYASMPTCSHDIWRLNRMNRNTPQELKVAMTLFLTLPAPPIVYYGEETGMRNLEYAPPKEGSFSSRNRSTCRTPMQWDTTANAGFSTADPSKLYLPVDNMPEFPNVAEQEGDPNSLLNYVRGLIALRGRTPALGADGEWRYIGNPDNPYPMIYERSSGGERYVVVLNPSGRKASGTAPKLGRKAVWVYGTGAKDARCRTDAGAHTFTMQPVSAAIFRIE